MMFCRSCGAHYPLDEPIWRCTCGGLLSLHWKPVLDISRIAKRPPTLLRYREAYPIDTQHPIIDFGDGFTPLLPITIAGRDLQIKQDHLFSTGSFKDRGAAILISKVKELGISHIVEDSSGNAGCAVAAYAAGAGISCDIFVPESTSDEKLAQIYTYGAALKRIPGTRGDTAEAALKAASKTYYASHCWNPFFYHGTKSAAYEISEQLGWKAPDIIVVPTGNGTLLLGLYIGFSELLDAGIISQLPSLIAVQSETCSPLSYAWRGDASNTPANTSTIAEGIAIAEPVRKDEMVDALKCTRGDVITVSDGEIMDAFSEMGRRGFFIEPTAAASIAGVKKIAAGVDRKSNLVTFFTGHGLKAAGKLAHISP